MNSRLIGKYSQGNKGPLLVTIGAMHGNEIAGPKAIEYVFKMLEVEPITNPGFTFNGSMIGIIGNLEAHKQNKRFIEKDMNRSWYVHEIIKKLNLSPSELSSEDREIIEVIKLIKDAIKEYNPTRMVVIDLHTTSSPGGIFSIPCELPESLQIAHALFAPVLLGIIEGMEGTSIHYFNQNNFDIPTNTVVFESGQHTEPKSVNRAIAGIINCLRTIECVSGEHVENIHDQILKNDTNALPKVTRLITHHKINKGDNFVMNTGYINFQKVNKGEILAHDKNGPIACPESGLILMPLYQKLGDDGFFIIEEIEYDS